MDSVDATALGWVAFGGFFPLVFILYFEVSKIGREQERAANALRDIAATLKTMDERAAKDQRDRSSASR